MKVLFYPALILLFGLFSSCLPGKISSEEMNRTFTSIDSLIQEKDVFTAREQFYSSENILSPRQRLIAEIFIDNSFNKPNLSNQKIKILLAEQSTTPISDSLLLRIKAVELDNSIKIYDYKRAKEITEDLLGNFVHLMSKEKTADHKNTLIIWEALKDQPKQEILILERSELKIIKDKVGLQTLTVRKDSILENFVFDTGANFSTITESKAHLFNMRLLEGNFEVNSITGVKVKSGIAVAPELHLGNIVIKNAVFLVFPDEALGFPQIEYQIHGILGFPVIEALKEIQITRDGSFIVPEIHSEFPRGNLAIDFLTPLLFIEETRGSGTYTFDTGAGHTMLYNTYYEKFLSTPRDTLKNVDYSFGGAGGNIVKTGSYIPFAARIGKSEVFLDSVIVLKEEINPNNKYLGNIGQDIIGQFEKMTINFDRMFIRFD